MPEVLHEISVGYDDFIAAGNLVMIAKVRQFGTVQMEASRASDDTNRHTIAATPDNLSKLRHYLEGRPLQVEGGALVRDGNWFKVAE